MPFNSISCSFDTRNQLCPKLRNFELIHGTHDTLIFFKAPDKNNCRTPPTCSYCNLYFSQPHCTVYRMSISPCVPQTAHFPLSPRWLTKTPHTVSPKQASDLKPNMNSPVTIVCLDSGGRGKTFADYLTHLKQTQSSDLLTRTV